MTTILKWNDRQRQIIDAVFKEKHSKVFAHGGVGSGKSVSMMFIIDFICQRTPGMVFLVGRKNYEAIKTDTHNILKRNPAILDASKGAWADGSREYRYHNGSLIYFRHVDHIEAGPTYGGIYIEQAEEVRKEDYLTLISRLRQWDTDGKNIITKKYNEEYAEHIKNNNLLKPKNYMFMTANPSACWLKEEFITKNNPEWKVIHLTTYDNRDYLDAEYMRFLETQSESYKNKYMAGSWDFAAGLCYGEFDAYNIVDSDFELSLDLKRMKTYMICDPGYSISKFAILYATVLPDGRIYLFDEISKNGKDVEEMNKVTIPEIARLIKEKNRAYGITPYGLIDFAANAKRDGNTSTSQQLQDLGCLFHNCRKDDEIQTIYRIQALLKDKKILIHSRCVSTIKEFGLFQWDMKREGKVKDADNDFMDCIRYLINDFPSPLVLPKNREMSVDDAKKGWYGEMFSKPVNADDSKTSFVGWGHDDNGYGL